MSTDITKDEIVNKLLEACEDATKEQVEKDVNEFITKLEKDGILE